MASLLFNKSDIIHESTKEKDSSRSLLEQLKDPSYLRPGSTIASVKGRRNAMEDEYLIEKYGDLELYGVFDGHGGSSVAKFVSQRIGDVLLPSLSEHLTRGQGTIDLNQFMKDKFLDLDKEIYKQKLPSGCCALVGIFNSTTNDLWIINLGDSRALLFNSSGDELLVTHEKTPGDKKEQERINNADSTVIVRTGGIPRIDGQLAVSRAFGDLDFKLGDRDEYMGKEGAVSPNPTVYHIQLDIAKDNYYLLLACDGLWSDAAIDQPYTNQELIGYILNKGFTAADLAEHVINKKMSHDNVTVLLIKFAHN